MILVLDASMTLVWQFKRVDPVESLLAERALEELETARVLVPMLWYSEVANGVLRGERQGVILPAQSTSFLYDLSESAVEPDEEFPGIH